MKERVQQAEGYGVKTMELFLFAQLADSKREKKVVDMLAVSILTRGRQED